LLGLDVALSGDKERDLMTKYHVAPNDAISFEIFYKIFMELSMDAEDLEQEANNSEYSKCEDFILS